MTKDIDLNFIKEATEVALKGVSENKGGPFGCVIVKNGIVVGKGCNEVISANDQLRMPRSLQLGMHAGI